jgi:LytS/YehU family sensor histidine kinase
VLTAILSPLANHLLTGMPATPMLTSIILQSALLGLLAAVAAARGRRTTLALLALVVVIHQALILFPVLVASGPQACMTSLRLRVPGILLQIVGGYLLLRLMARYLPMGRPSADEA